MHYKYFVSTRIYRAIFRNGKRITYCRVDFQNLKKEEKWILIAEPKLLTEIVTTREHDVRNAKNFNSNVSLRTVKVYIIDGR